MIDIGPIPEGWRHLEFEDGVTYVKKDERVSCRPSDDYGYWVMVHVQMTPSLAIEIYGFIDPGQTPRQRIEEMAKILLPHSALVGEWVTPEVTCTPS